ncbi:lysophospholipase L1-like esterase [Williamsia muralis]|uniref:Lysophospholipase L1-like esterase n=2 Tax=Williamsia marianensis TaxID=85044 RepID=A0A495JZ00_WILMA|nr:lysophospholipase L1-like esterase [Williamsia muralis]
MIPDMGVTRRQLPAIRGKAIVGIAIAVAALLLIVGGLIYDQNRSSTDSAAPQVTLSTTEAPGPMPPLLAVVGDSYTGGSDMGGRGAQNWLPLLAEKLDYLPCGFPVGGSGWTSGRSGFTFGARVDWAVELDPDLIIFFNGVNDLKSPTTQAGRDADAALSDLRAKDPDVPVVVIGPVLVQDASAGKTKEMANGIRAATLKHDAFWVDPVAEGWFAGPDRELIGSDQFHPTNEGMAYLSRKIEESLTALNLAKLPERKRDYWACNVPTVPDPTTPTTPPQ